MSCFFPGVFGFWATLSSELHHGLSRQTIVARLHTLPGFGNGKIDLAAKSANFAGCWLRQTITLMKSITFSS
jgi:hypothetical protein